MRKRRTRSSTLDTQDISDEAFAELMNQQAYFNNAEQSQNQYVEQNNVVNISANIDFDADHIISHEVDTYFLNDERTMSIQIDKLKHKSYHVVKSKSGFKRTLLFVKSLQFVRIIKVKNDIYLYIKVADNILQHYELVCLSNPTQNQVFFEKIGLIDANAKQKVNLMLQLQKTRNDLPVVEQLDLDPGWNRDFTEFLEHGSHPVSHIARPFIQVDGNKKDYYQSLQILLSKSDPIKITVAAAISGYLAKLCGMSLSPIIMLQGPAGSGKTSATQVAANIVHRTEDSGLQSAGSTDSSVGRASYSRNNTFIALDELDMLFKNHGTAKASEWILRFANGGGETKSVGTFDIYSFKWKLAVILNGNSDVEEILMNDKQAEALMSRIEIFKLDTLQKTSDAELAIFKNALQKNIENAGWGHYIITDYIINYSLQIKSIFNSYLDSMRNLIVDDIGDRKAYLLANMLTANSLICAIFGDSCAMNDNFYLNKVKEDLIKKDDSEEKILSILRKNWQQRFARIEIQGYLSNGSDEHTFGDIATGKDHQKNYAIKHNEKVKTSQYGRCAIVKGDTVKHNKNGSHGEEHSIEDYDEFIFSQKLDVLQGEELVVLADKMKLLNTDKSGLKKTMRIGGSRQKFYNINVKELMRRIFKKEDLENLEDETKTNDFD